MEAWESASGRGPSRRAIALLCAGYPDLPPDEAMRISVVERDLALLRLRERSFGGSLAAFAECSACAERLEFTLPTSALAATLESAAARNVEEMRDETSTVQIHHATSFDLEEAAAAPDMEGAKSVLLDRCVVALSDDGDSIAIETLPARLRDAAIARLEEMHGDAEISVRLACPACAHAGSVTFDIADYLWGEVRHAAARLMGEVHELAWAYGWSEREILAMSSRRRQNYLALIRQ
jgi:hypothetical protein